MILLLALAAPELHRRGRPWRRAKRMMHALYGYRCVICGHDGAREAGHIVSLADRPHQALDPRAMRPMHGSNSPCRACKGSRGQPRCCNQEQGTRPLSEMFVPKEEW